MLTRLVALTLGASLFSAFTATAQSVTFTTTTYTKNNLWGLNGGDNGDIRADLNGDGREDFISENNGGFAAGCTGSFAVTLSTGDGAYAAPACYTIPTGSALYFAAGDFSGNGKLDLAVTNDSGQLYIYSNNGTGALNLAYTYTLFREAAGIVAADVDHDGKIDLVYSVTNPAGTSQMVRILYGLGGLQFYNGNALATYNSPEPAGQLWVGDFDGDGHADILVQGVSHVGNVILYGDGNGDFTPGSTFGSNTGYVPADSASDGTLSVIGVLPPSGGGNSKVLDLEHGHSDRVLTSQHITLKSCAAGSDPVLADFDGDGMNDIIVAEDSDCKGDGPYTLNFMKNTGNSTFAPEQPIYSTNDYIFDWQVMRASHSSKPDLTVWQAALVDGNQITNPEQLVMVNTTTGSFPSCTPLNYRPTGISVCGPTSTVGATSPVNFSFAGSNESPGRDMEIWVDGNKLDESLTNNYSYYDFIQKSIPLSDGQHQVAVYSVGWDYSLLEYTFPLLVGSDTCPIPSGGINVCSPMSDTELPASSPVVAYATGQVPSGTAIVRMEVWVDGVKKYSTYGSNTLKTSFTLAPGWHQFVYYLVPNNGGLQSVIYYVSVQ